MTNFVLTPELLAAIAGVLLSLAFSYTPNLNAKFAALLPETKRLIMAGLLLLTAGIVFWLQCAGIVTTGLTCDQQGIIQLVSIFISALVANQSTYSITPQPLAVKDAKG